LLRALLRALLHRFSLAQTRFVTRAVNLSQSKSLRELGRELPPLAQAAHSDANKVQGCASQVWLDTTVGPNGAGGPVLTFAGDSDAHIVRGLIAILFAIYSGKSAREILNTDAVKLFEGMGLREHLTPQRSNGFRSMVERIRCDARAVFAAAA
jgi:cysteine desulfuration protein SufE